MKKLLMADKKMNIGCLKKGDKFYINYAHLLSWLIESESNLNDNVKKFIDTLSLKKNDNLFININFLITGNPFIFKNDKIFIDIDYLINWLNFQKDNSQKDIQIFIVNVVDELTHLKKITFK